MTVAVVTDSAASLPADLVERWGIRVVAQHLVLGGEDHPDGAVATEDVVARTAEKVTTSAPSPGEFLEVLEPLAAGGAVVVTLASEMSGTYKSAWLAATTLEHGVRVVDSRTAAGAEGLVALSAARAAAAGATIEEVEAAALDVAGRVQLVATMPGLEQLVRSGRVPGLAGWAGRVLGLQPLFAFSHGRARALRPSQSREAALDRIVARCLAGGGQKEQALELLDRLLAGHPNDWKALGERGWLSVQLDRPAVAGGGGSSLHLAAMHARAEDEARRLVERVTATMAPATAFVAEFSPVMVAHTGPGLVGLAWWWERPSGPGYAAGSGDGRSRSSTRRHR